MFYVALRHKKGGFSFTFITDVCKPHVCVDGGETAVQMCLQTWATVTVLCSDPPGEKIQYGGLHVFQQQAQERLSSFEA